MATTTSSPTRRQIPPLVTEPPQAGRRRRERPDHEHHAALGGAPHRETNGPYWVLLLQRLSPLRVPLLLQDPAGPRRPLAPRARLHRAPPRAPLLLQAPAGPRRPLALRARQHDGPGRRVQGGKHTASIFVSQDAEDHRKRPPTVYRPHRLERSLHPRSIVPPVHHHRHTVDFVRL